MRRSHFLQRHGVHLAGHAGVNIFIAFESRPQSFVAGKMGQHAQFDLRIIGGQQRQSGSPGKNAERISRPSSVRIGMFCKFGSLELKRPVAATTWLNDRVHATGLRMNQLRQRIDVRSFELRVLPILNNLRRQRMRSGQFFQHLDIGAGAGFRFLHDRQLLFDEQNFLQLLGRSDVEFAPGQFENLALQSGHPLAVLLAEFGQSSFDIDANAVGFQFQQHFDQRHFEIVEQRFQLRFL